MTMTKVQAQQILTRMRTLPGRHCIVCQRRARRVYGRLSHTDAVICTRRCADELDTAIDVLCAPEAKP